MAPAAMSEEISTAEVRMLSSNNLRYWMGIALRKGVRESIKECVVKNVVLKIVRL